MNYFSPILLFQENSLFDSTTTRTLDHFYLPQCSALKFRQWGGREIMYVPSTEDCSVMFIAESLSGEERAIEF